MDIASLYNISSGAIREAAETARAAGERESVGEFGNFFEKAIENLNTTNAYLSDAENVKLRGALGETDNTKELGIALQKASTALQYTVAVRDKFIEAYREIMQMQI